MKEKSERGRSEERDKEERGRVAGFRHHLLSHLNRALEGHRRNAQEKKAMLQPRVAFVYTYTYLQEK